MNYNVALKIRSQLGEGIWWDDRREGHFWIDIISNEIYFLKNGENTLLKKFDDALGFCLPCEDGRLAVGCGRDLQWWKEFFSVCHMNGYDGYVSLEMEDLTMSVEAGLETSIDALKATISR